MSATPKGQLSGVIESVARACQVLRAFQYEGEHLRLKDAVARTGLPKTTVHRLLRSLESGGLLQRVGLDSYFSTIRPIERRRHRIGFATQAAESTFSLLVRQGLVRVAAEQGLDLLIVDNRYSPKTALRSVDQLIRERVELVIEFQTFESVAPIISGRFTEVGIPLIAIEIPHPGAVYFGANNYKAGVIGGRALGQWARVHWSGQVDEVLMLEERAAGPLPRSRQTGMLAGMRESLPGVDRAIHSLHECQGRFGPTLEAIRHYLRKVPARKTLVAAHNDPSALGALRAFEEAGRERYCAVVSPGGIPEGRDELRRPNSRLIGAVAYFPERYGEQLIPLALSMIAGKPTPPAVFMEHRLLTPANVDEIYPLDPRG